MGIGKIILYDFRPTVVVRKILKGGITMKLVAENVKEYWREELEVSVSENQKDVIQVSTVDLLRFLDRLTNGTVMTYLER